MPYPSNDKLPEAVRNALPAEAQNIWRNAFNSAAEKYPGDEERASKIAWGAVKNAGWEKDAAGKWSKKEKSNTHEFEAEIFSVGTWSGDKYTEADLDDMVNNFTALKDVVKPPAKPGHTAGFGQPGDMAFGWIAALRRAGTKLVAKFSQVPDIVYLAIKTGRFKRVSAEIYWNFKHEGKTFRRVLAGVAFLGADIPAVTNLQDLEAYLSQASGDGSFDLMAVYAFETDGAIKTNCDKQGENNMPTVEELQKKFDAEKTARKKAEADKKASDDKLAEYAKQQAADRKKSRTSDLKAFCEDQVKAGKMTPPARDLITGDPDKHVYSEDDGFSISFETFKEYMEKQTKLLDASEHGTGGGGKGGAGQHDDAGQEVDKRAKKYSAEHKVEYSEAIKIVLAEDEELADEYANQGKEGDQE